MEQANELVILWKECKLRDVQYIMFCREANSMCVRACVCAGVCLRVRERETERERERQRERERHRERDRGRDTEGERHLSL